MAGFVWRRQQAFLCVLRVGRRKARSRVQKLAGNNKLTLLANESMVSLRIVCHVTLMLHLWL
jgi:hypothetical protein